MYRRHDKFGRRKSIGAKSVDFLTLVRKGLAKYSINTTDAEMQDFERWTLNELWQKYQNHCMEEQVIVMNKINSVPITIANGTKGKPYKSQTICLPVDVAYDYEFQGLEEIGLKAIKSAETDEACSFTIEGTPIEAGDYTITIRYKYRGWVEGKPILERKIGFAVNYDPRSLWKNIETPKDIPYYKEDTQCEYVRIEGELGGEHRKDMVAASQRGRSHAQDGKPRDDHFQLFHCSDSDWYIIAVADGAGSAKFSRKGSEIACQTVVEHCKDRLLNNEAFENSIKAYHAASATPEDETKARKIVGDYVYHIVGNAAYLAHKAINTAATNAEGYTDVKPKDFATTLLLAICKKFDFGWFVGSFWVGDGAMCIYDQKSHTATLLGVPDEGEFSGQTRFLTMPEIFTDTASFYKRLRFGIMDDFTALMLMTDGVSDPMFGTDVNLNSVEKWDELWRLLKTGFPDDGIGGVDLTDNNENSKDQLLNWLSFWVPGEHDDRTIAILY